MGLASPAPEHMVHRGSALTWIKDAMRSRRQFVDESRQGASVSERGPGWNGSRNGPPGRKSLHLTPPRLSCSDFATNEAQQGSDSRFTTCESARRLDE
jgi:hypothetical protein